MTKNLPDLSIIIPLFNEEENIIPLMKELNENLACYNGKFEILLVEDGGNDNTKALFQEGSQRFGRSFKLISHLRNLGQTAAMQTGILSARGEVIAFLDGDLQNDPADLPRMVEVLVNQDLDLLCGWREKRQDGIDRTFPSRFANWLISKLTGVKLNDYGCSLKVGRRRVLENLDLRGEMHRFIPLWVANITDPARIRQISVNHRPRIAGKSKYGLSRTPRVLLDLLAAWFFLRFRERPGHFFGITGLISSSVGGLVLVYLFFIKMTGNDIAQRPLLFVGLLFSLAGIQLITTGLLAEIMTRLRTRRVILTTQISGEEWGHGSCEQTEKA